MFSSKGYVEDVKDIPANWIFEQYLGLEPLTGQNVRIKSLFNEKDTDPSMYIYLDKHSKEYKFKCFSTNNAGSAIHLMMLLWKLPYADTAFKIKKDYQDFISSGKTVCTIFQEQSFWKLTDYKTRQWNKLDAKFWLEFNIGSDILEKYHVKPLEYYTMSKINDENIIEDGFTVKKNFVYGFFKADGSIYKVYQPYNTTKKFINISSYLQGSEQLTGKNNILMICSSLKDCMCIYSMGVKIDLIAPQSENTYLTDLVIDDLKTKYEIITTLFDSDPAGIKAMQYYEEKYNLPFICLRREKDISDIVKYHGIMTGLEDLLSGIYRTFHKIEIQA